MKHAGAGIAIQLASIGVRVVVAENALAHRQALLI
jgi:hypothetical protein